MKAHSRCPETSHRLISSRACSLDPFFSPQSIAVIGATEKPGSVGRSLFENLKNSPLGGKVFPVNSKRDKILGIRAYKSIGEIPEEIDLALIVTPAVTVPSLIGECVRAKVKAVTVISAGFKERGKEGTRLETEILQQAHGSLRIIGPNCLGLMIPRNGLNASFAGQMSNPGKVAFISQSGALCTAILDWSLREEVGFSAFISIGSMLDVSWGDLIDYFGRDPHTESIVIYMESIGDAHKFLSAAREVALSKPIIVIKGGRTEAAARAAASHTGAMVGSDDVLDAAFRRCGILRVNSINDLFSMTEVLAKQPRPRGPRLAVLTNAGGPGVLATDAMITSGGELAKLSDQTIQELNQILPAHWSHQNPVDILGDANAELYGKAFKVLTRDPNVDGILVILTLQAMTQPTETAKQIKDCLTAFNKPVLASWMGGTHVEEGRSILNHAGIPFFEYPDDAARIFFYMWQYSLNLQNLYQTPRLTGHVGEKLEEHKHIHKKLHEIRGTGRVLLTEIESKQILKAYDLPVNPTLLAKTENEAVRIANRMGYPVVLKLHSETITHKTDVGGVHLHLENAKAVATAYQAIRQSVTSKARKEDFLGVSVQPMLTKNHYELILGSSIDSQFGPVLLFGTGGTLVEIFKDRSLALPPLNSTLAKRMMERTRIYKALQGTRGRRSVDVDDLAEILVRFSQLVIEQRWIKEIDINPLIISEDSIAIADARIVLHGSDTKEKEIPSLAIRPYPTQYISRFKTKARHSVVLRPIMPEDEPLVIKFHQQLSNTTVYLRYFHFISLDQRIDHSRLTRICFNDYDREIALVVENARPKKEPEILAIGRLSKIPNTADAEFAILVSDAHQGKGLGTELLKKLVAIGQHEKLSRILGTILLENVAMQKICKHLGFRLLQDLKENVVKAELVL